MQIARRISTLAQKLGLTPVPTIDACLEKCFSDQGRAVLSPGQTAGMQVGLVGRAAQGSCLESTTHAVAPCAGTVQTPRINSTTMQ